MTPQTAPSPDGLPPLHDLVAADLRTSFPHADTLGLVRIDLRTQKAIVLRRTGTLPQEHDGCNALSYVYAQLIDAAVHTRQKIAETYIPETGTANPILARVYHGLLHQLLDVRRLLQAERARLS